MKPKMILTDLDNTLLRSDRSISERSRRILKKCQGMGILVVVATARFWIGAKRYIDEIRPDYEITTDGTLIHRQGEQVYGCSLDGDSAERIIRDVMRHDPRTELSVAVGRQVFRNSEHTSKSEERYKATYHDFRKSMPWGNALGRTNLAGSLQAVNKIMAELADHGTAAEIADRHHCRLQCYRGENRCAFLPEGSGKVQAIRELAKLLNVDVEDIVSFGDDANDVEMLRICGTGVAVSNAVAEAKWAADCVTLSNDEDGVADWLERNILDRETGCALT